jgi:hypothetical protein
MGLFLFSDARNDAVLKDGLIMLSDSYKVLCPICWTRALSVLMSENKCYGVLRQYHVAESKLRFVLSILPQNSYSFKDLLYMLAVTLVQMKKCYDEVGLLIEKYVFRRYLP